MSLHGRGAWRLWEALRGLGGPGLLETPAKFASKEGQLRPEALLQSSKRGTLGITAACGTWSSVDGRRALGCGAPSPAGFGAYALLDCPGSFSLGFSLGFTGRLSATAHAGGWPLGQLGFFRHYLHEDTIYLLVFQGLYRPTKTQVGCKIEGSGCRDCVTVRSTKRGAMTSFSGALILQSYA